MSTLIYNPAKPLRLWDGRAKVFSQCRGCGELMQIISSYIKCHPTCEDKPSKTDVLERNWIEALACDEKSKATGFKKQIDAMADEPPELTAAATAFATWGWPVFPLLKGCGPTTCKRRNCTPKNPCGKQPAISSAHPKGDALQGKCKGECGKPGHGFHDATADVIRINRWWTKHPDHNIGLATGHAFDVIDIDPRNGGVDSFMELLDTQRLPVVHGVAVTASGGMHLYIEPRNSKSKPAMMPGVDYKAKGGYVVGPPSTLGERGRDYTWLCVPSPAIKKDGEF